MWHDLEQVGCPRLAEIGIYHGIDVDYRVCDDKLEEPAEEAADCAREDYCTRRSDVGIGAFFGEVKGRVVAGHCWRVMFSRADPYRDVDDID